MENTIEIDGKTLGPGDLATIVFKRIEECDPLNDRLRRFHMDHDDESKTLTFLSGILEAFLAQHRALNIRIVEVYQDVAIDVIWEYHVGLVELFVPVAYIQSIRMVRKADNVRQFVNFDDGLWMNYTREEIGHQVIYINNEIFEFKALKPIVAALSVWRGYEYHGGDAAEYFQAAYSNDSSIEDVGIDWIGKVEQTDLVDGTPAIAIGCAWVEIENWLDRAIEFLAIKFGWQDADAEYLSAADIERMTSQ